VNRWLVVLLLVSAFTFGTGSAPMPGDDEFIGPTLPKQGECYFIGPLEKGIKMPTVEECENN